MLRKLTQALGLITLLTSAAAQALPIVQADAFVSGDKKAALETSTGLVWMDFGVNSHLSLDHVRYLLPTEFAGWRLATATEIDHLWTGLFGNLPEWERVDQSLGFMASMTQDDYFDSVFNIFGNSADSHFHTRDQNGNILDSWVTKSMFAVFEKEPGVSGYVSADSPYDNINDSTAMYREWTGMDVSGWFGTMLVKDSPVNVPEPSSVLLMLLAMATLVLRSRRAH